MEQHQELLTIKCFDGELTIRKGTSFENHHDDFWNILERDGNFVNCTKDVLQVLLYWIVYGKYVHDVGHSKLGLKYVAEYFGLELLVVDVDLVNHDFEKVSVVSSRSKNSTKSATNKRGKANERSTRNKLAMDVSDDMVENNSTMDQSENGDDTASVSSEIVQLPERRLTNQEKAKLKQQKINEQQSAKRGQKRAAASSSESSHSNNSSSIASSSSSNTIVNNNTVVIGANDVEDVEMQCMLGSKLVSMNIERMKESGSALFSQVACPTGGFTVRVNKKGIPVIFDAVPEEYVKPIVDFINTGLVSSSVLSKPASFKFGLAEIANILSLQSIYSQIPGLFIDFCTILEPEEQIVLGSFIAKKNMPFLKVGTWNLASTLSSPVPTPKSLTYVLSQNPTLVIIQTNDEKKYGALLCAYVKSKGTPQYYKYDFIFDIMFDEFNTYSIFNPTTCPHTLGANTSDLVIDLGGITVLRNSSTNQLFATMSNATFNIPEDQLTDFEIKKMEVFTFY